LLSSEEPDEKPEETSGTIEERETEDKRKHVGRETSKALDSTFLKVNMLVHHHVHF